MTEENAKLADQITAERFPTLYAARPGRAAERFAEAVRQLAEGLRLGAIPNVVLTEAKQTINRALEEANSHVGSGFSFRHDADDKVPDAVADIVCWGMSPSLHTLPGKIKKLLALKEDHPLAGKALALYQEAMPLARASDILKTKVIKRNATPTPPAEHKEAFEAPPARNATLQLVFDVLRGITEDAFEKVRQAYIKHVQGLLTEYMTYVGATEKPKDPIDYYRADPHKRETVNSLVNTTKVYGQPNVMTVRTDADASMDRMATSHAEKIRATFLSKSLRKVAAIVDAKGNLKDSKLLDIRASADGLAGRVRFRFEDGSTFTIMKSVVLSTSIRGRNFLRFPLTFHDVTMPDGSPLKQPSEERMNLVFAGRYYGTIAAPQSERRMLESIGGIRLGRYDEAKGAFYAEATEEGTRKLAEFVADFRPDLLPRSFDELEDMTPEGLAAELAWHTWAESLQDPRIYDRLHVPRDALQARIDALAREAQMRESFGPNSVTSASSAPRAESP
ncbi:MULTISPECIES: hypothetical protein [Cupriavidus]